MGINKQSLDYQSWGLNQGPLETRGHIPCEMTYPKCKTDGKANTVYQGNLTHNKLNGFSFGYFLFGSLHISRIVVKFSWYSKIIGLHPKSHAARMWPHCVHVHTHAHTKTNKQASKHTQKQTHTHTHTRKERETETRNLLNKKKARTEVRMTWRESPKETWRAQGNF